MKYLLFTTTRCPKCPVVKQFVKEKVPFEGDILDETHPRFSELIVEHEVQNAPTIIIWNDQGQEHFRGNEVSEIEDFLKTL